ncbi:MAG: MBL fold metallo-hydrolase, partial [Lachnoclostridium sp.]|nr:MBL fold metallo-hydrolase [Lachnoclostridium sp.]
MRLISIASGSSGNCVFVGEDSKGLLIDVGISMKRIGEGLTENHITWQQIKGICITHEHSDHITGLIPILHKYPIPVYGTEETLEKIKRSDRLKKECHTLFQPINPDVSISIEGLQVTPFSISHDAANPVCFTVEQNGKKVAIATDMGSFSDYTISHLKGSHAMLLEANHDISMLQSGSYPHSLKARILGERGHMSNDAAARLIKNLLHDKLQYILLGHLSEKNNYPKLAFHTVKYELELMEEWLA